MDIHELWVRGRSISQIARLTGGDRKTIRRLLAVGQQPRKPREVASRLAQRQCDVGRDMKGVAAIDLSLTIAHR